ncbi:MAG: GNAT family N-acetyltransferase [Kofleriaceae bacterium]
MDIRLVRPEDIPAVIDHVTTTLAEFGLVFGEGANTDDQLRGLPASYDTGAFWVAYDRDQLVGTAGVFPVADKTYELRKMYLSAATRGNGLAARMLETAIAWCREHGATMIVLDTTEQMTRAIAFYEKHGFVRDDAQRRGSRCSRGYALAL